MPVLDMLIVADLALLGLSLPQVGDAPLPTGTITRSCVGGPCPATNDPTRPLALALAMSAAFSNSTLTWYSPQYSKMPRYSGTFISNQYTILPSQFPTGTTTFTIYCDITTCNGDVCSNGRVIENVNIARPPICTRANGWWVAVGSRGAG